MHDLPLLLDNQPTLGDHVVAFPDLVEIHTTDQTIPFKHGSVTSEADLLHHPASCIEQGEFLCAVGHFGKVEGGTAVHRVGMDLCDR